MIIFVAGWKAIYNVCIKISRRVGMADEADSKSVVGNHVRVQVPLPALNGANLNLLYFFKKVFAVVVKFARKE